MTIYDAAMAVLLVLGMVRGAWRGFTWQVASLASLIVGYFSARGLSGQVAAYLPGEPEVQRIVAMAVVYVAVSGGIFALAWMVRGTLRKLKFDAYDRHLGMLLGGAEAVGVGLLLTLFVVSLAPATRRPIFASPSGHVMGTVMNRLGPVLPAEVRRALIRYWEGEPPAETIAEGPSTPAAAPVAAAATAARPAAAAAAIPALPDLEEIAADERPSGASDFSALTPVEPAPRRDVKDPALRQASGKPSAGQLDPALTGARQQIDQAAAEALDADPNQKASSLRQLVEKDTQRLKGAVTGTVDQTRQKVGTHIKGRIAQTQQELEQAIADSIAKGQQQVEQAITDSIDQQLRRLGGLQPAATPKKAVK
ncbi:MAG: CvpA family protein [Isosphaeraceae bacterium]